MRNPFKNQYAHIAVELFKLLQLCMHLSPIYSVTFWDYSFNSNFIISTVELELLYSINKFST